MRNPVLTPVLHIADFDRINVIRALEIRDKSPEYQP